MGIKPLLQAKYYWDWRLDKEVILPPKGSHWRDLTVEESSAAIQTMQPDIRWPAYAITAFEAVKAMDEKLAKKAEEGNIAETRFRRERGLYIGPSLYWMQTHRGTNYSPVFDWLFDADDNVVRCPRDGVY